MALSYRSRRRLALLILLVGLPVYIAAAVYVLVQFDRPPVLVELLIYAVLAFAWALPFRFVFRGVGQPDPGAGPEQEKGGPKGPPA
ncbi:MAG: DUF2842 domain-containing protein [Gemmobacter sp.]